MVSFRQRSIEKQFASILENHMALTNSGSSSNLLMIATIIANKRHAENFKIILPVAGFPTTRPRSPTRS